VTIALTSRFTRSICAMNARITSVADTFRAAIIRARRRAGVKTSSLSAGIEIPYCRWRARANDAFGACDLRNCTS
jgi:hypothetical protein